MPRVAADFFAASYAQAREMFLAACAARDIDVEHHLHPERGFGGEVLATDVARIGPEDARHVLVTLSATHGVEGFCGSAAQVGALRGGHYADLPPDLAVVLIHAINPYGFSWLRRVTHENVDLNRNHVDHAQPYPDNPGYVLLADAICPAEWSAASRARSQHVLDAYAAEHGVWALQSVVAQGQYSHPHGLFFGGHAPTWSARTLARLINGHCARAEHVAVIDYHTGLGPYGCGELIADHAPGEPGHARLREWLGADQITSSDDGSSSSPMLSGVNARCIARAAAPAEFTMVSLEFGTSPVPEVFDALRADCWLHNHGRVDSDQGRAIKAEIRRCFYPDAHDWREPVWERCAATERHLLAGLASLA